MVSQGIGFFCNVVRSVGDEIQSFFILCIKMLKIERSPMIDKGSDVMVCCGS